MNLRRFFGTGTLMVLLIASIHLLAQDPVPPIPSAATGTRCFGPRNRE